MKLLRIKCISNIEYVSIGLNHKLYGQNSFIAQGKYSSQQPKENIPVNSYFKLKLHSKA